MSDNISENTGGFLLLAGWFVLVFVIGLIHGEPVIGLIIAAIFTAFFALLYFGSRL